MGSKALGMFVAFSAMTAPVSAAPDVVRTAQGREAPRFGVMADVGLPDGATASLVYRPIRALRLGAGVGHNMISRGVRGEITWIPLATWLSPTLTVDYGHFAEGNANPLAQMISGDRAFSSPTLDHVGYDYANAHVGLEFGRTWFTFYMHAGMSYITGNVHNLGAATSNMDGSTSTVTFTSDPSVKMWAVSGRVGFVLYFAK